MDHAVTRRAFLSGSLGVMVTACSGLGPCLSDPAVHAPPETLEGIENALGGRLGVFAVDLGTRRYLSHRATERFAMCSTFKWLLAAQVLAAGLPLDERLSFSPDDLLDYAPVTRSHAGEGSMTLEALAAAAVVVSDNTAANLLLGRLGGPVAFTGFLRSLGDPITRLDRIEPALNDVTGGDPRDTTTPRAMAYLVSTVLCGNVLTPTNRERLLSWMKACATGRARLRAGLPEQWVTGNKPGTGGHGTCNDVAIAFPPQRAPIIIASYAVNEDASLDELEAVHASVGRLVGKAFGA